MAAAVVDGHRASLASRIEKEILKTQEHLKGVDDDLRRISGREISDFR